MAFEINAWIYATAMCVWSYEMDWWLFLTENSPFHFLVLRPSVYIFIIHFHLYSVNKLTTKAHLMPEAVLRSISSKIGWMNRRWCYFFRLTRSHGVEIYPKFDFDWLSFLIQVEIPVVEPQSISIGWKYKCFLKLAIHSIVQFFNCDDRNHMKIYLQLGNSMLVWASYNLGRIAYTASTN